MQKSSYAFNTNFRLLLILAALVGTIYMWGLGWQWHSAQLSFTEQSPLQKPPVAVMAANPPTSPHEITAQKLGAKDMPAELYPAWVATQQRAAGAAYAFSAQGQASNPAHNLELTTTANGVQINGWSMRLEGIGYAGQSQSGVESSPASFPAANRVEYQRGQGLKEWYVNGPLGLEQGFTLAQPWPSAAKGSGSREQWLSLEIGLTGALARPGGSDNNALEIVAAGGAVAHYGGLYAYDATGQPLQSRMELDESGQSWQLLVNVSGAHYPLVVDPLVQEQELTDSNAGVAEHFGWSVALSSDGNTALVGAYVKTVNGNAVQGAAFVFTRAGSVWSQQQQLTAGDGAANDWFGSSVALSADGNTALVGAYHKQINGHAQQGAAYIFRRTGTSWSQQQQLTAGDGASNDNFSWSVALSSDGNTALVGAYIKQVNGNGAQGAAYVFTLSGATWSQQQELTTGDGAANDNFGSSVALSSDGNTALVGAGNKMIGTNSSQGAVYAFTRSGATWSQQQKLTADNGATENYFGNAMALSRDGNTVLIGSPGANGYQGAVYAFTRSGATWSQRQELTTGDGASGDLFGNSMALSSDSNTALIGAYYKNNGQGAAYVFTLSGATWSQQQELTANDGASDDNFGNSVALSSDGKTALVGSPYKQVNGTGGAGATYAFRLNLDLVLTSSPNFSIFGQSVTFTATVSPITATGTVTFTEGANILGTGTLSSGVATFSTSSLPVGSHVISATYGGDANFSSISSNTITQIVYMCNPLVVTNITDDGAATTCGTFSYALVEVSAGMTITFALTQSNTITFSGSLTPTVKSGVKIDGGSGAGGIVLYGNAVAGDGLQLMGQDTLFNLTIRKFAGRELVTLGPGNVLKQVTIKQT